MEHKAFCRNFIDSYTQQILDFGFQLTMISKFPVSSERSCGRYEWSLRKNCLQAFL